MTDSVRVSLPFHLRRLAGVSGGVALITPSPATLAGVIDALEARFPPLAGTIRDYATGQRRPLIRFHACEEDLSHQPLDAPLPRAVAAGEQRLDIVGAIAGGEIIGGVIDRAT